MSESNVGPVDADSAGDGDGGADVENRRILADDEMVATAVDAGANVDLDGAGVADDAGADDDGADDDGAGDDGAGDDGAGDDGAGEDEDGAGDVAGDGRAQGVGRLEREGDIAADYLEELLDIADFDGDIDLDVENGRAMVSIVGTGLGNLVGQRGATLDALQDLTRLAVLRSTGERSRLMLDIAGTRARRKEQLHQVGTEAAERARADGEPVRMDPMTPFERKVVHDAVAAAGLRSESDGVEPNRRVVVYPS